MAFAANISEVAEKAIKSAKDYHDSKIMGSGTELLSEVLDSLDRIENNPFMYQIRFDTIRAAPVKNRIDTFFCTKLMIKIH